MFTRVKLLLYDSTKSSINNINLNDLKIIRNGFQSENVNEMRYRLDWYVRYLKQMSQKYFLLKRM